MHFKDLICDERILRTLETLGFQTPTSIQTQAIPLIMEGGDLCATSQTGSGKTAAFLLPTLVRLIKRQGHKNGPQVLILAPTRELAIQLNEEITKLSRGLNLTTVTLYGGVPYPKQYRQLSKPFDVLIATPGRLIDHMEQKKVNLKNIEMFILDEADRMLDMGFIGPVKKIAEGMPSSRQTLMFSATFGKNVRKLAASLLQNPKEITNASVENKSAHIEQLFYQAEGLSEKQKRLEKILTEETIEQAIIFSSTKIQTQRIADNLREKGLSAAALHGDMNQRQRTRTIEQFRTSKIQFLVATDVASRGIDVLSISHVINFDLPNILDDYIHRIGRTGRAGNKGKAFSFFSQKDHQIRKEIEKFSGVKIDSVQMPKKRPHKTSRRPFRQFKKRFAHKKN